MLDGRLRRRRKKHGTQSFMLKSQLNKVMTVHVKLERKATNTERGVYERESEMQNVDINNFSVSQLIKEVILSACCIKQASAPMISTEVT